MNAVDKAICEYVHGDIRHLEREHRLVNYLIVVHGDIRHLEKLKTKEEV